jgi:membrane-associated phospholipid phosphatase
MSLTYEQCISSYPQLLFFALIILCHAYHVSYAYAFIGYIGNSIVNSVLKQGFRSIIGDAGNRPVPYSAAAGLFDSKIIAVWPEHKNNSAYGFPSGHAQSVGYFVAFAHQFLPWRTWHPAWIAVALSISLMLMWTRIAFRRHTAVQVLFGFAFGVATFRAFHWGFN